MMRFMEGWTWDDFKATPIHVLEAVRRVMEAESQEIEEARSG